MRAIISNNQLIFPGNWGIRRRSRPGTTLLDTPTAHHKTAGPSLPEYVRFWLTYWGFTEGQPFGRGMKNPRAMPAVGSPAPATCMCCWYQQHYNPARPVGLPRLAWYACRFLAARLFPPLKPAEIDGLCSAHIDLLYPPRRGRAVDQSSTALADGVGTATEDVAA